MSFAAAAWIGAALALQVIAGHMRSSTPDAVTDRFAIDAETIGKALFAPAAVVLVITLTAVLCSALTLWFTIQFFGDLV